jgi:amidase
MNGKPIGPFHGVPITLKDQFNVKGYDTTLGYTGRALKPASEDAVLVKMLRSMGAVIIAKTNIPQSIMASDKIRKSCGEMLLTVDSGPRQTIRFGD